MNTQQLKEELQAWQEHYSDPADKNNYDFFTALIAAVDRLEAAERERDELKHIQELNVKIKQAMHERFTRAEAEIARRDAVAGEAVADMWLVRKEDGIWKECGTGYHRGRAVYFNHHIAAAPPAIGEVRLGEYRDDGTRPAEVICLHEQADWENFADGTKLYLGAQPQKPVVLPEPERHRESGVTVGMYRSFVVYKALDAANVPYEVKK